MFSWALASATESAAGPLTVALGEFDSCRLSLVHTAPGAVHARPPGKLRLTFPHPSGSTVMVQLWLLPWTLRFAFFTSPPLMAKASSRSFAYPTLGSSLNERSNVKRLLSPAPPCSAGTFAKLAVRVFAGVSGSSSSVFRIVPSA